MSSLLPALLTQSIYYLPSVLAHCVILGLAAWLYPRSRAASLALAGGTVCQLLASVASFSSSALMMSAAEVGWQVSDISPVFAVFGVLASLLRMVGEVVVGAAVYLAVTKTDGALPAEPVDPYGYKRG